jgi:hypothetical protein
MAYDLLPSLKASFTPVPHIFLDSIFDDPSVSREELIVTLFCFKQSFGWQGTQIVIHFELIAEKTCLTEIEAEKGLAEALKRNTLIGLPADESNPHSKKLYMLNLLDNKQFVETYYTNSNTEENRNSANEENINFATEENRNFANEENSLDEVFDYEDDDELIPFEDEVGGFKNTPLAIEPVEAISSSVAIEKPTVIKPADSPVKAEPDAIQFADKEDAKNDTKDSSDYLPPGMSLPYNKKTVEMIGKMLGRSLSKAETHRLADLGANDQNLIEAMSSLLSKSQKVYSSDLIVYEYEQIESNNRTSSRYEMAKVNRQGQIEKQRNCMKCGGLGYIFQGLNNIHECDCKK